MSLLQEIKDASIAARIDRSSTASFLVTLYSECAMVGKSKRNSESTDEEVISVLKKFKAGAETIIESAIVRGNPGDGDLAEQAVNEIVILDTFLPVMLEESKLERLIRIFVEQLQDKSQKQKGEVMGYLKKEFAGLYDGKLAMDITSRYLK